VLRSDCHRTPVDELRRVFRVLGDVDLDPCADVDPKQQFARESWTDRGNRPWGKRRVFLNPPYSRLAMWVPLCARPDQGPVIALIPPSTGTAYWHSAIFGAAQAVCFFRGRLAFRDSDTDEPAGQNRYDSAAVLWGADSATYQRFWYEYGGEVGKVVVP